MFYLGLVSAEDHWSTLLTEANGQHYNNYVSPSSLRVAGGSLGLQLLTAHVRGGIDVSSGPAARSRVNNRVILKHFVTQSKLTLQQLCLACFMLLICSYQVYARTPPPRVLDTDSIFIRSRHELDHDSPSLRGDYNFDMAWLVPLVQLRPNSSPDVYLCDHYRKYYHDPIYANISINKILFSN
jgi:hypothetical protein